MLKYYKNIKINVNNITKNIIYCENELDPFYTFKKILNSTPIVLCKSEETEHICYQNHFSFFVIRRGVICLMKNLYINPKFWKEDGYNFDNGPTNKKTKGTPLISKGFFNMKCDVKNSFSSYNKLYKKYFTSWNYSMNINHGNNHLQTYKKLKKNYFQVKQFLF